MHAFKIICPVSGLRTHPHAYAHGLTTKHIKFIIARNNDRPELSICASSNSDIESSLPERYAISELGG